ncbi:flagellar protein FliT [Oceanobacillus massiliensis]|uniref:flagellar protein FliT n=1 Tax=Oceanobacillus massiliensis TaxID=1465765 RepID=UPI000287D51D|nr:flagellar protein FliT [Oceanobacillus massiliensis]
MNRAKPVYDITLQIQALLSQEITAKSRESAIEKLNELVHERGHHMESLVSPYTAEEKQLGNEVLLLNNEIEKKMHILFADLKMEMIQVKRQKKSNQSYTNPYKHVHTLDGMFMDSKK